ncbi:futalosine hydrolase, putative [Citrifermentans bemidjiense Bem]|uniref:Futalosine hydrolase n=1 Tax=Citrifermentans bemidjiense (strain ATCC BAA-1014 / DSM 16622 / JCM 12645 / Bem) TaxID=404380 RepID=B5ED40_CITBB|nr:futalosine hydrolase [Citrifermentans bemidjiense]ACH37626.1 futalosine hydrolase, putative [Citrifermentans bemidjiense Bem]
MKPVIVTASTTLELSELIAGTSAIAVTGVGHLRVYRASYRGVELVIAVTGIGKVNAAAATTLLLERFGAELLINTGCGGAFPGCGLGVGDLAIAQSETLADEGVQTPDGWRGLELIGIPVFQGDGKRIFNTVPLDLDLARGAEAHARELGYAVAGGPFLTVSTCSGSALQGQELLRRFPGVCENMEGGAVAQVALPYAVPLLEVRGISNLVEDRDLARWDLKLAVSQAQKFLLDYLEHLPLSV